MSHVDRQPCVWWKSLVWVLGILASAFVIGIGWWSSGVSATAAAAELNAKETRATVQTIKESVDSRMGAIERQQAVTADRYQNIQSMLTEIRQDVKQLQQQRSNP